MPRKKKNADTIPAGAPRIRLCSTVIYHMSALLSRPARDGAEVGVTAAHQFSDRDCFLQRFRAVSTPKPLFTAPPSQRISEPIRYAALTSVRAVIT